MKVVFRVDASVEIGTGHVMRCLTLADALRAGGADATFVCRAHEGHLGAFIRDKKGFKVELLSQPPGSFPAIPDPTPVHAHWLGTSWRTDADQTMNALAQSEIIDWLFVDHYALDERWESALRTRASHVFVLDDLADRPHDADALLDQNFYPSQERRYAALVATGCRQFLGPRYALLREEFQSARAGLRTRSGTIRRILIFFGGADPSNETRKAIEAWRALGIPDLTADVVVGSANPHREDIRRLCEQWDLQYHFQTQDMAGLMARADLAIGAGGTATWERCCLGLPSICISIAENQREVAEAAAGAGLLHYLGHFTQVRSQDIASAILRFLANPGEAVSMGESAHSRVDGKGADRIAGALSETALVGAPSRLRRAGDADCMLYFGWANDPDVRVSSFQGGLISLEDHKNWFSRKIRDPRAFLFLMEYNGVPVGQIRFDASGETADIDFSVAKEYRGRGLGKELLEKGVRVLAAEKTPPAAVRGLVKKDNVGSAKAFDAAGFRLTGVQEVQGVECLVFLKRVEL